MNSIAHRTGDVPAIPAEVDHTELAAALPGAVDLAMRTAVPGRYTPELAARIAANTIAHLAGTACQVYGDCTQTEPGHYDHSNHEDRVTGEDGRTILDVGMVDLSGGSGPHVYIHNEEFNGAPALRAKTAELRSQLDRTEAMADRVLGVDAGTLASLDQRVEEDIARLAALIAYRRRVADKLTPGRTPLTENAAEEVSSAAFHLATSALQVSLEKAPAPAETLRAMRTYVDMAADEARA